jgi:phenylpyruvate tautomerase PptA (4-oxalocrotonate tautomerase family)
MPTLRILTNVQVPTDDRAGLLTRASRTVAELLGKPESYVMVILDDGRDMLFAGSTEPAAYLELKSLGLPEGKTADYSRALCELLTSVLAIPAGRVYIEFAAPPRHLFGWNGGTF